MDYFVSFNLAEGVFWLALSAVLFFSQTKVPQKYKRLTIGAGTALFIFGLSDFTEVFLGSFFEPGLEWLFAVKIICVVSLVCSIVWYLRLRIAS